MKATRLIPGGFFVLKRLHFFSVKPTTFTGDVGQYPESFSMISSALYLYL